VKLKPEFVEKYKECHAKVWPEVLKQIKDCNIEDCESIFWENLVLWTFITWKLVVFPHWKCRSCLGSVANRLGTDSIFHDPETHILFASFKYVV